MAEHESGRFAVQAFQKIPALHAPAPRGSEPPLLIVQVLVPALFVILATRALRRFQPTEPPLHA